MRWFLLILALFAQPAAADVVAPDGRVIDCYCTDTQGARVELDEVICLFVNGRSFLALCEMAQNNPIWRDTGEPCVSSALDRLKALLPIGDSRGVDPHI